MGNTLPSNGRNPRRGGPTLDRQEPAPPAGPAGGSGYPGAAAPQPNMPNYVHANMFGGQRAMPQGSGMGGMLPYMDGNRPPEMRGENLYPWRPMPRQMMPQMQKTYTIKNDVNLKKTSLKLVCTDPAQPARLSLEFDFDASTECRICVYLLASEIEGQPAKYAPREGEPEPSAKTFPKGLGQAYRASEGVVIDVSTLPEDELKYNPQHPRKYPIIVRLESVAPAGSSSADTKPAVQSQSTFGTLVHSEAAGWTCRVLKQTIQVGSRSFELQEIYGIDQSANGTSDTAKADDLEDEGGRECVICMTDPRDTTVLPCRHMCMCNKCAQVLRLQTNKCPICRCNVDSLLQIKVMGSEKPEPPAATATPGYPAAAVSGN